MNKILLLFALSCSSFLFAQENFNFELISNVPFQANDVWSYEDDNGIEYAIVGEQSSTHVYSLEDPANPILRAVASGSTTTWRDIKVWEDHIYVTSDSSQDGLLIIDMADAPEVIVHTFWNPEFINNDSLPQNLNSCHNIFIDEFGIGYLSGCDLPTNGVVMIEFSNPKEPTVVGMEDYAYAHDAYAKNNILYASEIYEGKFTMYDVTDKSNPIPIGAHETSMLFTHNAWLSDDEQFLFTTDERANAYVDSYDVSDPDNIIALDKYQPEEVQSFGPIPHNTHYHNGYLVTSWYTEGVIIIDGNKPDNLVRVGQYDTWEFESGGFSGCWGTTPFLESGLVLASDRSTGLYVLKPTYVRACYLEGSAFDFGNSEFVNDVRVEIISDQNPIESTQASGEYKMGQASSGTYEVIVTHPDYPAQSHFVELINGEVTILDISYNTVSTDDLDLQNEVTVTPNPFNDVINVEAEFTMKTIEIMNIVGEKMVSQSVLNTNRSINTSTLQAGLYLIKIYDDKNNVVTKKLIKQ